MALWAFNVGDGDTVIVDTEKLSTAAVAVETEWPDMVNGCIREGRAMYLRHWRCRNGELERMPAHKEG